MKVYKEGKSAAGRDIVLMAIGREELKILLASLLRVKESYPYQLRKEMEDDFQRMGNMVKVIGRFLEERPETHYKHDSVKDTPCPHCKRTLRGEKALEAHIKMVHTEVK